jgi:hypothetical protein
LSDTELEKHAEKMMAHFEDLCKEERLRHYECVRLRGADAK